MNRDQALDTLSASPAASPRPGRPLNIERERALLDAALDLLSEVGYHDLTVAAVCGRAGASTKTAYRRWGNKDELLTAALRRAVEREVEHEIVVDLSQGLRAALVSAVQRQAESFWWSPNLVVALIVASRVDGDLGVIVRQVIQQSGTERARAVLSSARLHGEVDANCDPEEIADLFRSLLLHEVIVRDKRPSLEQIERFVDNVVLPACAGSR